MWTYLVSAIGQQYAYEIEENGKKAEELKTLRDQAVKALKRALREDREAKALLSRELVPDPNDNPKLFNGDLRYFADDAEVRDLLLGVEHR
jgi:hypothetical protein